MEWLYRKDNNEKVCCWGIEPIDNKHYKISYGRYNGKLREETILVTQKDRDKEINSKITDKRKQGYKTLDEVRDDAPPFNNQTILEYLEAYLPSYRNNENNGNILPMLAKSYTGKYWDKNSIGLGQYKINGERCCISAYIEEDIFRTVRLKFQSREGVVWNSLSYLEDYLIDAIPTELMMEMINNNVMLDGEVYLPGYHINEINSFIKNTSTSKNKHLQFWCYDIIIDGMSQSERDKLRLDYLRKYVIEFNHINDHLNNTNKLIALPTFELYDNVSTIAARDEFINLGFEGLILRNPNVDYQFGRRRVGFMEKFKDKTDGKFRIIDIQREQKRDLPIITCMNDINNNTFDTRFSYPHDKQRYILENKEQYIGKYVFIEFGERSGVTRCPFHIKKVTIIDAKV